MTISDLVFYGAISLAFIGLSGVLFHSWRRVPQRLKAVPLAILLILAAVLSLDIVSSVSLTENQRAAANTHYLDAAWDEVEKELKVLVDENNRMAQGLAIQVVKKLDPVPATKMDALLEAVGTSHDNIIQDAVGETLRGVYYRGITSDAMDPFAMIIGKSETDSFIFADFSENCAVEEITRSLFQEYELQARDGNRTLAVSTFRKLVDLHPGYPLQDAMFFQFEDKDGVSLETYSLSGLKKSFYANKGDLELTFKSIEFLAPAYIFRDRSLGGTPRVEDRVKTNAKTIAIVSVFSFWELLIRDDDMLQNVEALASLNKTAQAESISHERASLTIGILVMLITLILFIYFWTYSKYHALHSRSTDVVHDSLRH